MADCDARGPLVRSGSTQASRDLAELDPAYFRIDERELPDLVLYAQALSREIVWYDASNVAAGDWAPFFASDVTATLAGLARLPVAPFRQALADAEAFLRAERGRPEAELRAYFNLVFHLPVALFGALAAAHARLSRDHPLHPRLTRLVEEDLAEPLAALVGWYKGGIGAGLPFGDPAPELAAADFGTGAAGDARPRLSDTVAALIFAPGILTERAMAGPSVEALGAPDWESFAAGVAADPAPYLQATAPNLLYEQVFDALTYNLLSTSFERVFQGLERARGLGEEALAQSLEAVDDHAPHYGLFLAFLEMLAVARQALNGMSARHLDFYCREVLRMAPRPPVPASAHVLFELAKGVEAHLAPAGTPLKAGKDATGKPVTFRLADDIVLNRGGVEELRAIRVHGTVKDGIPAATVHAAPVADSADGLGAPLPEGAFGWSPFGPPPWPAGSSGPGSPFGRIGFAVADRRLFLQEGERTIRVRVRLEEAVPASRLPALTARLTAPDGWLEMGASVAASGSEIEVSVVLDRDQPPVVPFDREVHGLDGGYAEGLPVMEVTFAFAQQDDQAARGFAALREARFELLRVSASAEGLRDLALQTPEGAADPAKPFAPFGARPKAGAAFILGTSEVFAKPLSVLAVKLDWETPYSREGFFRRRFPSSYKARVAYLAGGAWRGTTSDVALAPDAVGTAEIDLPQVALAGGAGPLAAGRPTYGPKARTGFLRLELTDHWGHAEYPGELTRANIAMARKETLSRKTTLYNYDGSGTSARPWTPKLPYEPFVTAIALDYTTTSGAPEAFYHVAPFGQEPRPASTGRLLPALPFEAALNVGVAGLEPPARLTLLAQAANGTGDPLLETPALVFHYLAEDGWRPFAEAGVDDKTENFAASAVLGLAVPADATVAGGRMPAGRHWLRIAATENAAAVNRLIALRAQAARAVFVDAGNDPQFLAAPVPPGTIAKLVTPDPKVKAVEQPFASFGGAPEESDRSFRRRASERLRHKDRGSTIWDYERLALAAAPELYRVKCLPHTELVRQGGKVVADNEVRPGGVVVVTVPWTQGRPHLDPLRPFTDQATLKKVRDVLRPRLSPFVRLEVANPKFEEVQVDFKVAFREGIDDTAFYLGELRRAVTRYLAPWSSGDGAGADITFGGRLRKSAIINFVEELPFVDYLEDFYLYHRPDPTAPGAPADMEIVEATTARSILASAPSHLIAEIA